MIAAQLQEQARKQIETARVGRALAYRDAEPHPADMVAAPTNNLGALFRAAYWSATAARIALSQGSDPTALFTLAESRMRSATAATAAGSASLGLFSMLGLTYSPSGTDSIDSILLEVERLAARFGVEEVASTMFLQRRVAAAGAAPVSQLPTFSIPWFGNLAVFNKYAQIGVGVSVAVVVLGALLWVARPLLVPAAKLAGQAASDAYARRRERRRGAR